MSKIQLITVLTRTQEYVNHPLFSAKITKDNILRHLSEWLDSINHKNENRVFKLVGETQKALYNTDIYRLSDYYDNLDLSGFPYILFGDDNDSFKEIKTVLVVIPLTDWNKSTTEDMTIVGFGNHNFKSKEGEALITFLEMDVKNICNMKESDVFYRGILIVHDFEWYGNHGTESPFAKCLHITDNHYKKLFDYVCIFKHERPNPIFQLLEESNKIEEIVQSLETIYPEIFKQA